MPVVAFFLFMLVLLPVVLLSVSQKRAQQRAAASKKFEETTVRNDQPASRPASPYVKQAPASPYVKQAPASPYVNNAPASPLAKTAERRPLEKAAMKKTMPEKPIAEEDHCENGSIHDGYHEGVTQFDVNRPAAVAGKLGARLADESDKRAREEAAAENARRAVARISKLPPIAQGVVWSEILGKPKSEIA